MHVRVKLYARLERYLPDGAKRNETDVDVRDGATVAQVLGRLGVPREYCHLVLVNGEFVAPSERDSRALTEGDTLAAWPPVAGGGKSESVAGGRDREESAGG